MAERYPQGSCTIYFCRTLEDAHDLADRLAHWRKNEASIRKETLRFSEALRQRDWNTMAAEIVQIMLHGRTTRLTGTIAEPSPVLQESCTP